MVLWSDGFSGPQIAADQPRQPGAENLPERQAGRFYEFPRWTARPTPANMARFGAAPPSTSVRNSANWRNFIQPSTPDANREHADQACAAIALVRVLRPTDTLPLIC